MKKLLVKASTLVLVIVPVYAADATTMYNQNLALAAQNAAAANADLAAAAVGKPVPARVTSSRYADGRKYRDDQINQSKPHGLRERWNAHHNQTRKQRIERDEAKLARDRAV